MCIKAIKQHDYDNEFSFNALRMAVQRAIQQVYEKEWSLLVDKQIIECAVAAQLFYYIKQDEMFKGFDVDSEYNKMLRGQIYSRGQLLKRINELDDNGHLTIVRPDIIIHQRGPKGKRVLWIEVKLAWGDTPAYDIKKIIAITNPFDPSAEYVTGYSYGLSIVLGDTNGHCVWIFSGNHKIGIRQCFNVEIIDNRRALKWGQEYESPLLK